jgi:hypothetical protein
MTKGFFDHVIQKQGHGFMGRKLRLRDKTEGYFLDILKDFLEKRLERAIERAKNETENETDKQRFRGLVRCIASISVVELQYFWLETLDAVSYERLTDKMMKQLTYETYADMSRLIKGLSKGVEAQIAMIAYIEELHEALFKRPPEYTVTLNEAIDKSVSIDTFNKVHEKEAVKKHKTLIQYLDSIQKQYENMKKQLETFVEKQKLISETTSIKNLQFEIDTAIILTDELDRIKIASSLNVFGDSLSILFKLQWKDIEKLSLIEKASAAVDKYLLSEEFDKTVNNIQDYLDTYKDQELYKKMKDHIVSERTVQLVNNAIAYYY